MGRMIAAIAAALVFLTSAAFAEDAINPAKWSKNQWRSDLFDTYPTYPRHFRTKVIRHETVIKNIVVVANNGEQESATPVPAARPKLIRIDGASPSHVNVQSVSGSARGCTGALVITWAGDRAVSKCRRAAQTRTSGEGP